MDGLGKAVLVAEDDESNRILLGFILSQARYKVHLATNGYDAVPHMLTEEVQAVITDWEMPGLTGSDLLLISRIFWPETPVIVVSACAAPFPESAPLGAFAWFQKPYDVQKLLQILHIATHTAAHQRPEHPIIMTLGG